MAYSQQSEVSDGTLQRVILSISFYNKEDIHVYIEGRELSEAAGEYSWEGDVAVYLRDVVPAGETCMLRRSTDMSKLRLKFSEGVAFTRNNLDDQNEQFLHMGQEAKESALSDIYGDVDMHRFRIRNAGDPVKDSDYTTKGWVDRTYTAAVLECATSALIASNAAAGANSSAKSALDSAMRAEAAAGVVGPQVREALRRSYAEIGLNLISGSFEDGATITNHQEVLLQGGTGKCFNWQGAIPVGGKIIPADSTPESTGGIGKDKWQDVTNTTQHSQAQYSDGVNYKTYHAWQGDVTLQYKDEAVQFKQGGMFYRWDGVFPQGGLVIPQSTPEPSPEQTGADKYVAVLDLELKDTLASVDGISNIGTGTYADIRKYVGSKTRIYCSGRKNVSDFGFGTFVLDASDTTTPDNDGTVLVDTLGRRWKRQYSGNVSLGWFLDGSGPLFDAAAGIRACVNAHPYERLTVPPAPLGYYIRSTIVEPQSASFQLIGDDGMQVNHQQLIYVDFNGPAFECADSSTVFTKYQGLRFETNKAEYPLAQAIRNNGFLVHGEFKNITAKYFVSKPIQLNGYNCCNFEQLLFQFNDSVGLYALAGAANTFDRIIGDNNNHGVMYTIGASNSYRNLYSEDCCKSNVSSGDTNPEFYFGGDAPTVTNLSINSYKGNSTPPVKLDFCRNMTMIGVSNKSTQTPAYPYEIELTNRDSSLTLLNSSGIRIKSGADAANTVKIDSGYATTNPSIIVGGFGRDLIKNTPVATVSISGTSGAIYEANGVASVTKEATGTYTVELAEPVKYVQGIRITGGADADGYGNQAVVSEVGALRSQASVTVKVSDASGTPIDSRYVSIVIYA